jgi:probable O-glycosylation ligase (exosortase A-associated)
MGGLRDIVLTLFVFGMLPVILRRPDIGVLMWTWLSLMSPHRLTWGFAFSMPFAQLVGFALLVGVLISNERKRIPWSPLTVIWALFVLWLCVTTYFALNPEGAMQGWEKSMKIQIVSFIILIVMQTPARLKAFVWVVALSVGFYGIKGGIFTIVRGGEQLVFGPAGSFIEGNNELAMALVVIMPLLWFLSQQTSRKWLSWAILASIPLCALSVLGSHSRGAFLAIGMMGAALAWKSRRRSLMIAIGVMLVPVVLTLAPQKYWDRMSTIKTYEQDSSAMGRINAWIFAWNLVKVRPVTGGGYETFTPELFKFYAPDPDDYHDVHSIYFEILGEQGWPGFIMYMLIALLAYWAAGWTAKKARGDPEVLWQYDLARMTQVSLVGYWVGGAFLGLAYYDLYYDLIAIIVLNRVLLERRLAQQQPTQPLGFTPPASTIPMYPPVRRG